MNLPTAICTLRKELREEKTYYQAWQANIAAAFIDALTRTQKPVNFTYEHAHDVANKAAKQFLNTLIQHYPRDHGQF